MIERNGHAELRCRVCDRLCRVSADHQTYVRRAGEKRADDRNLRFLSTAVSRDWQIVRTGFMSTTHPQPREQQDLDRLLDRLAERWAAGQSTMQIGARLGLTKGAVIGIVARARKHGDDRFRPRLTPPKPKPKVRRLKPVDKVVGNSRALPPPPEPPRPVPFLLLRPGQCHFPLNSPERGRLAAEMLCCGVSVVRSGASYCSRHDVLSRSRASSSASSLSPRAPSPHTRAPR